MKIACHISGINYRHTDMRFLNLTNDSARIDFQVIERNDIFGKFGVHDINSS